MTPAQIETAARRKYNSASSSFYATAEIYDLIYQAELEIARETKMLEGVTTTSTIAGTQSYSYPSGVLEIKRVEYNGTKLMPIDFRQDDALTLMNSNSTTQGTPIYYYDWANTIYLRPIPQTSSVKIRIHYYKEPLIVSSATQTLEVPALFHMCIVDYVTAEMAMKDGNQAVSQIYFDKWYNKHLPAMQRWVRNRRTGDSFKVVRDEESLAGTLLGRCEQKRNFAKARSILFRWWT
jgi:hypothetical protein